uniref:DUF4283 domain-containing protein n=1 Tax=Salix viminalis TaxID=40686 RepID=A0A6N2M469_SALVM
MACFQLVCTSISPSEANMRDFKSAVDSMVVKEEYEQLSTLPLCPQERCSCIAMLVKSIISALIRVKSSCADIRTQFSGSMTLEAPMVLNIISHKNWLLLPRSWVTHLKHDHWTETKTIWNGAKPFKVIDPENEFFLVQFSTMNDYLHVLVDGPWTILGPGQNFEASITWTHYKDVFLGAFSLPFQLIGNMYKIDYNTQNNH